MALWRLENSRNDLYNRSKLNYEIYFSLAFKVTRPYNFLIIFSKRLGVRLSL